LFGAANGVVWFVFFADDGLPEWNDMEAWWDAVFSLLSKVMPKLAKFSPLEWYDRLVRTAALALLLCIVAELHALRVAAEGVAVESSWVEGVWGALVSAFEGRLFARHSGMHAAR
jgi:hypothetical protein